MQSAQCCMFAAHSEEEVPVLIDEGGVDLHCPRLCEPVTGNFVVDRAVFALVVAGDGQCNKKLSFNDHFPLVSHVI